MIEKKMLGDDFYGIFATDFMSSGDLVYSWDGWVEDEVYGWDILTVDEVSRLKGIERKKFLRYAYDISFGSMVGTFDWSRAKHTSNFMNHSCQPNMVYDENNSIVAARDIYPGEELTVDYGNFIVNIDQDFNCNCGNFDCRHRVKKDDWKKLVFKLGYQFPVFMHEEIRKVFESEKVLV